ncbi:MAG: hypothetical protein JO252_09270 [Planctomycetaceae bacterium]|nr:hypothetical protein [Planctomycetaceae bacterium]MBV8608333.1 hypothetical protein [Singulisphaera sp.]
MPRATRHPAPLPVPIALAAPEAKTFREMLTVLPDLRRYVLELKRSKKRSRP